MITNRSQGNFTSTGKSTVIDLVGGVDAIYVYNKTVASNAQTTAVGVKYMWLRGFDNGGKWTTFKANAANSANLEQYSATGGFTFVDSSDQSPSALQSIITSITTASIPVVNNSGTNGLVAGDVVRMINITGATQLGGIDFTVGNNTLTGSTFSLDYMAQIAAATTGSFRKINYNPLFYPRRRIITKISQASQAVVTLSVTHQYTVGQQIRLNVPAEMGMVEMNNKMATIVAIDTDVDTGNTITINIDSTSFTAFAWPTSGQYPAFTPAQVVPIGENTAFALEAAVDILEDATENTGYRGMLLAGGANSPAGQAGDQIYWVAELAQVVDNQI